MNPIVEKYSRLQQDYHTEASALESTLRIISILRLVLFALFFYVLYAQVKSGNSIWGWSALACVALFVIAFRIFQTKKKQQQLARTLADINKDEISYLDGKEIPFEEGKEHVVTKHPFSYDLDIFGAYSLYHRLNRTNTHLGAKNLANALSTTREREAILEDQEAVIELKDKLAFRQSLMAYGRLADDSKETVDNINKWINLDSKPLHSITIALSYLLPLLMIAIIIAYAWTGNPLFEKLGALLFFINLTVLGTQYKSIQKEIQSESLVHKSLNHYAHMLELVENESFQSSKLQSIKANLTKDSQSVASSLLQELSNHWQQLDTIHNPAGAVVFNGLLLYHLHQIKKLLAWKDQYTSELSQWMDDIAELEKLSSLANLAYNKPQYSFPDLNNDHEISFVELGHPFLSEENRVDNSVSFNDQSFIILTGSNMSGKSTFLRSLGLAMVMTHAGAPICAKGAKVHPLDMIVSMRLSDSINDSESYFFAEVKRLKEVMNTAQDHPTFVLLDEILRGTNSDDKRQGTIQVLERLIQHPVKGVIATHDLKVCDTTASYPNILCNKNFEVAIVNDQLQFDYKLRDGVCQSKSATHIMKQMDII